MAAHGHYLHCHSVALFCSSVSGHNKGIHCGTAPLYWGCPKSWEWTPILMLEGHLMKGQSIKKSFSKMKTLLKFMIIMPHLSPLWPATLHDPCHYVTLSPATCLTVFVLFLFPFPLVFSCNIVLIFSIICFM